MERAAGGRLFFGGGFQVCLWLGWVWVLFFCARRGRGVFYFVRVGVFEACRLV